MKSGCIHVTVRENRCYCMLYQHKVTPSSGLMSKRCEGTKAEKEKCPEWGETLAAEEYYKKKLKSD
jgi:hypothetical protein